MRILVIGDGHSQIHEVALSNALKHNGNNVHLTTWFAFFKTTHFLQKLFYRLQDRFLIGPQLNKIQKSILLDVAEFKPEIVFVYRGTHVYPKTIEKILHTGAKVVAYNNDDPFSRKQPWYYWRHYLRALPLVDLSLAYRKHNLQDMMKAGARKVALFRSWYLPEKNRPVILTEDDQRRFSCDVTFVGHFESDGRLPLIEALAQGPWKFKLFGPEWQKHIKESAVLTQLAPISMLNGEEYNKAIVAAKIAICFLSKLNRDTYTRRCFEIPATGTMMLSEYSDDLATIYKEDEEVVFFRTQKELLEKISFYLNNDELRKKIAAAGRQRVLQDGHDINSRAKQLEVFCKDI